MLRHCEINVKLVFHEIIWKKNFTVYPSLKEGKKLLKQLSWRKSEKFKATLNFSVYIFLRWRRKKLKIKSKLINRR